MKALNEKEVLVSYVKFVAYLVFLIVLTQLFFFTFLKTSESEISEIKLKSGDSEKIFKMQVKVCDDMDEFFDRYRSFDMRDDLSSDLIMRSIVDKKMAISKNLDQLPEKDVKVHAFLLSRMDDFLRVRDSISEVKPKENRVKKELFLCTGNYDKLDKKIQDEKSFEKARQ